MICSLEMRDAKTLQEVFRALATGRHELEKAYAARENGSESGKLLHLHRIA